MIYGLVRTVDLLVSRLDMRTMSGNAIPVDVIDSPTSWIQALAAVVTATGLALAGAWAVFRFRLNRTSEPRFSVELNCSTEEIRGRTSVLADVKIMNCGDCKVKLQPYHKGRVEVSFLTEEQWKAATSAAWVQWPDATWPLVEDLSTKHRVEDRSSKPGNDIAKTVDRKMAWLEVEPGQDFHRSCLFIMPDNWTVARVCCLIQYGENKSTRTWYSTRILWHMAPTRNPTIAGVGDAIASWWRS